jgi:hypothetical protein
MALLIGTDEAGYGPNLGPLVISATAWQVPADRLDADLYAALSRVVCRASSRNEEGRLAIDDSKKLYKPGGGLAGLERGVLACLRSLGCRDACWRDLWRRLAPEGSAERGAQPWHASYDGPLPREANSRELDDLADKLARGFQTCGVRLTGMRSVAIFPERWNALLDRHSSKGEVLAQATLHLVGEMLGDWRQPALVQCDKFGGRNRYAGLLQTVFPDSFVEAAEEGRRVSVYRWGPPDARIECRFTAGGEQFLPTALASMTSKYLRELAMLAFNDYWAQRVPGLKPTAGYPVDARRFKADIAAVQRELNIDDRVLWRRK